MTGSRNKDTGKLDRNLEKLVKLQILHFFNLGFIIFIAYDIYQKSETLGGFFLYYLLFTLYRVIALPVVAWMVLRGKLKQVIGASFVISFLLAVGVLFFADTVESPLVLMHLYALPLALFTTFFQMGNNQLIAQTGKDAQYSKFFYLTGVWKNAVDVALPILLGVLITAISYKASFVVMAALSLYSIYTVVKMDKMKTGFNGEKFKDIFRKTTTAIPKKIQYIHYGFIFVSGMLLQYLDMAMTSYQFAVSTDELKVGILRSIFVVALYILYKVKTKTNAPDKYWFYGSLGTFIGVTVLGAVVDSTVTNYVVLFTLVVLVYTIFSSSTTMSFTLMGDSTNFEKFAILFKREIVRTASKIVVIGLGMFWSIDTIESVEYKMYTVIMIAVAIGMYVTYREIDKYVSGRD